MTFKTIIKANGAEAIADDMSPRLRAFALLLEHAHQREAAHLPVPCTCGECLGHRATLRALSGEAA